MTAVFAFHTDKAIVQIAAIKIPVNDIQEIGTEESVRPLESLLVYLVHPLELAVVEIFKLFGNGSVQLLDAEKGVVPKRRHNPSLGDLHRRLHLGLVFRLEAAGGNDDRTVMAGKLMIGRIDLRFIVAGLGHVGLEIARNEDLRNAAEEVKRPDIELDPRGKILGESGPGKRVAAGPKGGDKRRASLDCPETGSVTGIVWTA